jgi:hypothetical protein
MPTMWALSGIVAICETLLRGFVSGFLAFENALPPLCRARSSMTPPFKVHSELVPIESRLANVLVVLNFIIWLQDGFAF